MRPSYPVRSARGVVLFRKKVAFSAAFISVLLCAFLAGCETTPTYYLSPDTFRKFLAKYSVQPGNKAAYINTDDRGDFWLNSVMNGSSPQEALDLAKSECEKRALSKGYDPEKCVPVAVNDKQLYDPIPGAVDNARQAAQNTAETQAFIEEAPYKIKDIVDTLKNR